MLKFDKCTHTLVKYKMLLFRRRLNLFYFDPAVWLLAILMLPKKIKKEEKKLQKYYTQTFHRRAFSHVSKNNDDNGKE